MASVQGKEEIESFDERASSSSLVGGSLMGENVNNTRTHCHSHTVIGKTSFFSSKHTIIHILPSYDEITVR